MQGDETYKKHGNLPALRRQSSEIKEAKIGRIHMPEYWEGESYTEKIIYLKSSTKYASVPTCEKTTKIQERLSERNRTFNTWSSHRNKKVYVPISQK